MRPKATTSHPSLVVLLLVSEGTVGLLLGSDDDSKFSPDHVITQSMILVRVLPATKEVVMLSIPRDLYVHLSTGGSGKIDGAYYYGGERHSTACAIHYNRSRSCDAVTRRLIVDEASPDRMWSPPPPAYGWYFPPSDMHTLVTDAGPHSGPYGLAW